MIVLNNFWNKDYLQKSNKNGSQRCWVMTLKSSTKKGGKMLLQMHSQEKDEDVEALLCAISIIQPEWITEERDEWKNDEEVWTPIQKLQQSQYI